MLRWGASIGTVIVLVPLACYGLLKLADARTFQLFGDLTARVETSAKVVALTFDDGPDPAGTEPILTALAKRHTPATFFLTGRELAAHPELGRRIVAAGHQVGNHTYSHHRMMFVSPGYVRDEVERTDAQIRRTGYRGPIDFRPPNGKKLATLPYYLSQHHRRTIMWDVEPNSYPKIDSSAAGIADYTVSEVRPGSIILLHGMYPSRGATRAAVGPIIDRLTARGYRFVTVTQLLSYAHQSA